MIYDAFAHLPIYGLEDLGFVPRGEAGAFIAGRNTAPGGKLPLNTNGGGLSERHSGMYGMYALQESVRQMRGTAPAQIPVLKFRSATASAACSPHRAPSSCPMSRRNASEEPAFLSVTLVAGRPRPPRVSTGNLQVMGPCPPLADGLAKSAPPLRRCYPPLQ